MKNILQALILLCITASISAQNSGTVHYTETMKLHFNIQGSEAPPPGLPEENKNNTLLFFTSSASLYMNDTAATESIERDEEMEGGGRMRIVMDAPDTRIYTDLENKTITSQEDFMQRKFLVEREMSSAQWKLTGQQKVILGYPCMEAVKKDSLQTIVAWFTSAIPVATGPAQFTGLPGLVLQVNINDGEQVITATSIADTTDASYIKKPKEGKKVTAEQFDKIVADKMKEMGMEDHGAGGTIIIKMDHN